MPDRPAITARCVVCLRGYIGRSATNPDPHCFTCDGPIRDLAEPTEPVPWDELKRPFHGDTTPPQKLRDSVRFATGVS